MEVFEVQRIIKHLINIRFQRNNVTGSSARFVINSEGGDKNPIYLYSPYAIKRFLGLHNISEVNKHLLSGERPGAQDIRKVKAEDLSIESNAFYCSVSVPEGASSLLVWTINDKEADMILTDNSVEVKPQFTSFPNHNWKVAVMPVGKGEHEFAGKVVVPFCTSEGSGESGTFAMLKEKLENADAAEDVLSAYLALTDEEKALVDADLATIADLKAEIAAFEAENK